MIELPDEKWTPYVTVIGIGELGVRVLLKLSKRKRQNLKLCAVVPSQTQKAGHEDNFVASAVCAGDVKMIEQPADLHHEIQKSDMFLVVADTTEAISTKAVSAAISAAHNIGSFALLITADGKEGQGDYIHQTGTICMMPEALSRRCATQPQLFDDEADVVAEMAMGMADMHLLPNLVGFDSYDIQEALSRPGKMTIAFGQGNTMEQAVEHLLLDAENSGVDALRCNLAIFSMSGARSRLSIYDVNEAPYLMAKKMGREIDSLTGDSLTLLSAPIDDSLGDKVKIFAVFCEGD